MVEDMKARVWIHGILVSCSSMLSVLWLHHTFHIRTVSRDWNPSGRMTPYYHCYASSSLPWMLSDSVPFVWWLILHSEVSQYHEVHDLALIFELLGERRVFFRQLLFFFL